MWNNLIFIVLWNVPSDPRVLKTVCSFTFTSISLWQMNVQSSIPFSKMGRLEHKISTRCIITRYQKPHQWACRRMVCLECARGPWLWSCHYEPCYCTSGCGRPPWLQLPARVSDGSLSRGVWTRQNPGRLAKAGRWPGSTVHILRDRGSSPRGQHKARLSLPGRTSASPTMASPDQDQTRFANLPPRKQNLRQELTVWVPL